MSKRIIIACILWFSILAAAALTGCTPETAPVQGPAASRAGAGDILRDSFRVRRDEARDLTWVLGLDGVRVYDSVDKQLVRTIALPNWSIARRTCDPDMVLDGSGSAIISSNAQSRLWRIDANSFEVKEHEITLQGRERWDAGFGALALAGDGSLLALMSFGGAMWNVDLDSGTARMVAPTRSFYNVCGLASRRYGRAESALDAFVNFVPAAGSDYAMGSVTEARQAIASAVPSAQRREIP
jgi:hypothetical protein